MKRANWFVSLLALVAVSALLLAACGGDDDDSNGSTPTAGTTTTATTTAGTTPGATGNEIDQDDLSFKPAKLTVKVGEQVTFRNSETAVHTVDINGKNESGTMKKGDVFTWTPSAPGEYKITCEFHPQMKATITVTE